MNDIAFDDIMIPVTDSVRLEFHADGTYTLKVTGEAMDLKSLPTNEAYLLQCYSNGCVNKVSVNDLLLLRRDFPYSHGVYPHAKLMVQFIVKDEDYLEVVYKRNATERIVKIVIKDVNTHSILGLKGKFIIGSAYDEVTSWKCDGSSFESQTKSDIEVFEELSSGVQTTANVCSSNKQKSKAGLSSIASYVGKNVSGKVADIYSNHYFILTDSFVRILLPKKMSDKRFKKGDCIDVTIALADIAHETLYATRTKPIDYKIITKTPLLNNGDIIEVSFKINGGIATHKCYNKINITLKNKPRILEYGRRYSARVVCQTNDKFSYSVRIL